MDKNLSALVLRDTGMNNNDLLKSKLPKCWTIDVLSIKEDKEEISVALPSYDVIVGGRIGIGLILLNGFELNIIKNKKPKIKKF